MDALHIAYKNGAVISGTSAGAAVMSKKMITGNQLKHKDTEAGFVTIEPDNIEITQVIVIKNPGKIKNIKGGLLGTEGLQLSVYVPGQKFKLR